MTAPKNPVTNQTALRSYPGWVVREYQDGTFDAAETHGNAITIGVETFGLAVAEVRVQMTHGLRFAQVL